MSAVKSSCKMFRNTIDSPVTLSSSPGRDDAIRYVAV